MPNIESIILGSQRSPKGKRGPPEPCLDAVRSKLYSCGDMFVACVPLVDILLPIA